MKIAFLFKNPFFFRLPLCLSAFRIKPSEKTIRVKPTQNSLIERFNRTFRQKVLDCFMFSNMKELRTFAHAWMWISNNERPHSSPGYLTPHEFLLKYGKLKQSKPEEFPTFQQDKNNKYQWKSLILNVAS